MAQDRLDKRFGIVAVENGFITSDQLIDAMKIQVYEDLEGSKHRLIGEILQDREHITADQIDKVLELMGI